MKKLEDLSRNNIFKVPDGYFEKLPAIIQSRVATPERKVWLTPFLKMAMPGAIIVLLVTIWITSPSGNSIEEQLSEIKTEELLAYLDESELSIELLTEEISLNETELTGLEEDVFSAMEPLDIRAEELSVEPENF
jgi:hypothetical protein